MSKKLPKFENALTKYFFKGPDCFNEGDDSIEIHQVKKNKEFGGSCSRPYSKLVGSIFVELWFNYYL